VWRDLQQWLRLRTELRGHGVRRFRWMWRVLQLGLRLHSQLRPTRLQHL